MKRFVTEAYNHFIRDCEKIAAYNQHPHVKAEYKKKIENLNIYRNAYICGMITEREAIIILKNNW